MNYIQLFLALNRVKYDFLLLLFLFLLFKNPPI